MTIKPLLASPLNLALALCLACAPAFAADRDIDKVNGAITVEAGERMGNLETVNGSINVGASARVASAETVNGSIKVGDKARTGGLETVNGSIRVGEAVYMGGDVGTVNGSIFIDRGGEVRGAVETVNGAIGLVDTDVSGGIETLNGDLTVGAGSHVRGGILYRKARRQLISLKARTPRVVIGPNARVDGPLVFEREVKLYVHSSATSGPVTGATAVTYEGARAPQD
ncbi:MAG: hypothetical protein M3Q40_05140 [Pseudomonadota bacterium]|nr:hypothetical protein [Pseudomonadota bacterium]